MQIAAKPSMMNPREESKTHYTSQSRAPKQSTSAKPDTSFFHSLTSIYRAYFTVQTALKDDN